jgi:hypothetical protein
MHMMFTDGTGPQFGKVAEPELMGGGSDDQDSPENEVCHTGMLVVLSASTAACSSVQLAGSASCQPHAMRWTLLAVIHSCATAGGAGKEP